MTQQRPRKTGPLRKYPALMFLIAAAGLAVLLPTALNVPQSGPSTLAEFAPVPGAGKGSSDVSELGQAGSGGLGFGSGTRSGDPGSPPSVGKPDQTKPRLKRCVGNPPRQTEDPLSPPCVAFFNGDNGGVTGKGVTKDEVSVVFFFQETGVSSHTEPWEDCTSAPAPDDGAKDLACKAYTRYFNDRYQTYGRTVRIWAYYAVTQGLNEGHYIEFDQRRKPFAFLTNFPGLVGNPQMASRGTITPFFAGWYRDAYRNYPSYYFGFRPDHDDAFSMAASYLCSKLAGRRPQFAGPGVDQSKPRTFGIFGQRGDPKAKLIQDQIKAHCGLEQNMPVESTSTGAGDLPMARMKAAQVSTIIAIAPAACSSAARDATVQGYFPEWFIPGYDTGNGHDTNAVAHTCDPSQWQHTFGLTFDYRRDAIRDQPWYRAFREGCPGCTEPAGGERLSDFYETLTMLFYGIQSAGPRLTPANLDKGLHAIPANGSPNPYKPAAYFAPGNYSFLKDAMEIWWDPQGQAPDDPAVGCYRLPNGGKRFRDGEWESGDQSIQRSDGSPCQGTAVL